MAKQFRQGRSAQEAGCATLGPSPRSELQCRVATMPVDEQLTALQPERPFAPNAGAVQAMRGGGGNDSSAPASEKPKNASITLSVRKGGNPFSRDFWGNLNVGHAWVDIVKPNGRPDSWGFSAADVSSFPVSTPWKDVAGVVLHPDGSSGASGQLTERIDEEQLEKGEKWADGKRGAKYNLFGLNCAKFATSMFEEATAKKAPTGLFGALIANPNSLSDAINKHLEKEAENGGENDGQG